MHFDPELNAYTSESPADTERSQNRSISDLEKRVAALERLVAQMKPIVDDMPIRNSGSLKGTKPGKIW